MIKWAVANQKGGVGKTTTVVSLGGILAKRGMKTLLLDMDPHGSMTAYFCHDPDNMERSLYQLFHVEKNRQAGGFSALVYETEFNNLYLLPASTALATLDRQLAHVDGMGLVVDRFLRDMDEQFDFALIDCPPQLGVLMVNALAACNHLIIPVQTEFLALKGLERMMRTLTMIASAQKQTLTYTIVPTMFDPRTRASVSTVSVLQDRYSDALWPQVIPVDTQFREASRVGMPLPIRSPKDRGSLAYECLLNYLLTLRIGSENSAAVA